MRARAIAAVPAVTTLLAVAGLRDPTTWGDPADVPGVEAPADGARAV